MDLYWKVCFAVSNPIALISEHTISFLLYDIRINHEVDEKAASTGLCMFVFFFVVKCKLELQFKRTYTPNSLNSFGIIVNATKMSL